jgi:hypothetical protein
MKNAGGRDDPDLSADLITLVGFLSDSDRRGHPRLFVDSALTRWLGIRDADIVDRRRIPDEQAAHGGRSVLLVKRGAVLTKGEVTTADAEAEFLSGGDARALRCEPDLRVLVGRSLGPIPPTLYLTPTGPNCC